MNVRATIGGRGLALVVWLCTPACVGSEATFSGDASGTATDAMSSTGGFEAGSNEGGGPSSGASSGTDGAASSGAGPGREAGPGAGGTGDAGDGGGSRPAATKPGFDLTAGGNVSKSTGYKLVGAVGESPGGNVVGKSTSFTLKGGVVAGTQ